MKKLLSAVMVAAFVLSTSIAFAATVKCTVDAVDGDKVTLTCSKADKLEAGAKVKVKTAKKKSMEGC